MSWRVRRAPGVAQELVETLLAMPGEVVSGRQGKVQVIRLAHEGRIYYRKQAPAGSLAQMFARLFRFRHWGVLPELEALNLQQLETLGFAVIPVLAAGSRYRAAFPVGGFMLSADLPGEGLGRRLMTTSEDEQHRLATEYGHLTGRLHRVGGYEALRATDVLVSTAGELVLLDREKPLVRGGWQLRRAAKSLQRAWFRNQRSGLRLSEAGMQAFWTGYRAGSGLEPPALVALQQVVAKRLGR